MEKLHELTFTQTEGQVQNKNKSASFSSKEAQQIHLFENLNSKQSEGQDHKKKKSALFASKSEFNENKFQPFEKFTDEQVVHLIVHRMVAEVIRKERTHISESLEIEKSTAFRNLSLVERKLTDDQVVRATVNRMVAIVTFEENQKTAGTLKRKYCDGDEQFLFKKRRVDL
ncbi:hypothetical protein niasHS_012985 [Heterodera schachtii]|uniref:Uncharacterized protein n=1 Tax=Heterodera schachtii TaxID=97005 RepID=A0ABD2IN80_HETSC